MIDQIVGNVRYIVEFQHGPHFDTSHSRTLSRKTDKVLPRGYIPRFTQCKIVLRAPGIPLTGGAVPQVQILKVVGTAKCDPYDNFNRKFGRQVSWSKAFNTLVAELGADSDYVKHLRQLVNM